MIDNYTAKTMEILILLILSIVLAYPVMMLWNMCLVPAIDGIHEVTWSQMFGLMVLSNVLFKKAKL